jgi:hypothetical protein
MQQRALPVLVGKGISEGSAAAQSVTRMVGPTFITEMRALHRSDVVHYPNLATTNSEVAVTGH